MSNTIIQVDLVSEFVPSEVLVNGIPFLRVDGLKQGYITQNAEHLLKNGENEISIHFPFYWGDMVKKAEVPNHANVVARIVKRIDGEKADEESGDTLLKVDIASYEEEKTPFNNCLRTRGVIEWQGVDGAIFKAEEVDLETEKGELYDAVMEFANGLRTADFKLCMKYMDIYFEEQKKYYPMLPAEFFEPRFEKNLKLNTEFPECITRWERELISFRECGDGKIAEICRKDYTAFFQTTLRKGRLMNMFPKFGKLGGRWKILAL